MIRIHNYTSTLFLLTILRIQLKINIVVQYSTGTHTYVVHILSQMYIDLPQLLVNQLPGRLKSSFNDLCISLCQWLFCYLHVFRQQILKTTLDRSEHPAGELCSA